MKLIVSVHYYHHLVLILKVIEELDMLLVVFRIQSFSLNKINILRNRLEVKYIIFLELINLI